MAKARELLTEASGQLVCGAASQPTPRGRAPLFGLPSPRWFGWASRASIAAQRGASPRGAPCAADAALDSAKAATPIMCILQKNYWFDPAAGELSTYHGVNDVYQLALGVRLRFEVQFHTEGSYAHKTETHALYNQLRTSLEYDVKLSCSDALERSAKRVPLPPRVLLLPTRASFPPRKSELALFAEYLVQRMQPVRLVVQQRVRAPSRMHAASPSRAFSCLLVPSRTFSRLPCLLRWRPSSSAPASSWAAACSASRST